MVTRVAVAGSVVIFGFPWVCIEIIGLPTWVALLLVSINATVVATAWVVGVFGGEFVLRPMVEDVASYLPDDFEPTARAWRLRTKALLPLPVVALYTALMVGAFANASDNGLIRAAITWAVALATTAVAGLIFFIITRSVLDPLDELIAATRRVRAGDMSTRVPLVTADDLGQLGHSFNQMMEGLQERESLREHNVELVDELRESRARIVAAADAERRSVERDLHDGAQQHLVLLGLKLGMAKRKRGEDPEAAAALIDELSGDLDRAIAELRDLAHGIYPVALESDGLPGALGEAVERAAIPATLECNGAGRYPPELEAAVYFCCLEALQNASKHAGEGAKAEVELAERDGALMFTIADDGRGYEAASVNGSAGLQNMTDRIGALGGSLRIESATGRGTRVLGSVPLAGSGT
jgi:signal transduction histidine kinase